MTVDAYYMEIEMLLHRARVRESIEMTMQHFWHGLKYNIKGIVRHHHYTTMNEILHHAREAESQLAEEAQVEAWYSSTRQFFCTDSIFTFRRTYRGGCQPPFLFLSPASLHQFSSEETSCPYC
jgi:hypothetical protein